MRSGFGSTTRSFPPASEAATAADPRCIGELVPAPMPAARSPDAPSWRCRCGMGKMRETSRKKPTAKQDLCTVMTHLVEEVSFFEMGISVGCAASQSKRKWSLPFRLGPTRIGTRATFWCIFRSSLPRHRHAAVLRILLARRGRLGAACAAVATVSALAAPAAVCAIEQVLLHCRAVPSAASDDRHYCAACRGGTFHPPPATAPKSLHRGPQHNPPPTPARR